MRHCLNFPVSECDNILTSPSGKFHILSKENEDIDSEQNEHIHNCWLIIGEKPVVFSVLDEYRISGNEIRIYGGNSSPSPQLLEITESMKVHGDHRHPVVSITNQILVLSNRVFYSYEQPDLNVHVRYSSCSVLTSVSGRITSPGYPKTYDLGAKYDGVCWIIRGSADYNATLTFIDFSTNNRDFVRVYDGASTSSPQLLMADGNEVPSDISPSSNEMLILFSSGDSRCCSRSVIRGFQAIFHPGNIINI